MSVLTILFNILLEVLINTVRQEKNKSTQIGKKERKLQMIWLSIQKIAKIQQQKIPSELTSDYSKIAIQKFNVQKSIAFLYTINEHL